MDKKTLMDNVAFEAFALRIDLTTLCKKAGVGAALATRYKKSGIIPHLANIGRLERALNAERVEQERAS
jgi:hypothetical protein